MSVILECPDAGETKWGVSLTGSNPEPIDFIACVDQFDAGRVKSLLRCPICGSEKLIPPAQKSRFWTCDPCGQDFDIPQLIGRVAFYDGVGL